MPPPDDDALEAGDGEPAGKSADASGDERASGSEHGG
jgi:hypothetical protein